MSVETPPELTWLETALALVVSVYTGTIYLLLTGRQHHEQKLETRMLQMENKIQEAEDGARAETQNLWTQFHKHAETRQLFEQTILRDMREMPTRADLVAVETRITETIRAVAARQQKD